MRSTNIIYDYEKSKQRIKDFLNTSDVSYETLDYIPTRDQLTYSNGFYVNCTALFVDIRNSSKLSERYQRPSLARIYRSFISETVAIINGCELSVEIMIEGDCVWGIFNTTTKSNIDRVFETSAQISSLVETLNIEFKKKNYDPIKIGIGIDYGRALMIQTGHKGSSINEVVWMGDVINSSAKLSGFGNKTQNDFETMISDAIYNNLCDHYKSFMFKNTFRDCYHGSIVNILMNEWVKKNEN